MDFRFRHRSFCADQLCDLQERGTLPPDLEKRIEPVSEDLEVRLAPPPEGCRHVIVGGHNVLLMSGRITFRVWSISRFNSRPATIAETDWATNNS